MNIFHYKKTSGEYKAFDITPTDEKDAVFCSVTNGVKSGARDRLVMKLNKQELAYIIMETQKIYNSLVDKDDKND